MPNLNAAKPPRLRWEIKVLRDRLGIARAARSLRDRREAATELQRDAAISLLLEAPVECTRLCGQPCGECWPCRVYAFLRDAGARR